MAGVGVLWAEKWVEVVFDVKCDTDRIMFINLSGPSYSRSSVMTDQVSNLIKKYFPKIRRNERSLIETINTPKCDKLHVFDMMEEMKRKSLLIEYYLCAQQNFMKQN